MKNINFYFIFLYKVKFYIYILYMNVFKYYVLLLIPFVNGIQINNNLIHTFNPIVSTLKSNVNCNFIEDKFNINTISDYINSNDNLKPGVFVVRRISSMLPHVDSIGHNILHANNQFISDIFDNDIIPYDVKKSIILSSIRLAQFGDDMGSHLLQIYYDIVDNSL